MFTPLSPTVLTVALVAPLFIAPFADAQVQSVTPYYAFVTSDKATVRSGDNDRFYKVGELPTGSIVVVDGEGNSWSRISYPANLFAYVKVEDVRMDGDKASLAAASKLKAANVTTGYSGSWKSLLDVPLPAGTSLRVIEPAKEIETTVGYKVAVPDSARAFVETRALRRATDAEVAGFKDRAPALPNAATPIPGAKPPAPANPTTTTPTPPVGSPVNAPNGNPGVVPSARPAAPETRSPNTEIAPSFPNQPTNQPAAQPNVEATREPTRERPVGSIENLEDRFKAVWKQPEFSEDIPELRSEYQRAIDAESDDARRRALQSRIDIIDLRMRLRDSLREQEAAAARLDASKSEIAKQVETWERSRVYSIVGVLQPSTVYDGKHLPQMFRVVSVGGTGPRTLGYLKPTPDIDLTKMLGHVVGVIGEANMDRSLKLNIITPVRVEALRSASQTAEVVPDPSEK